jgi:hypothetical protein
MDPTRPFCVLRILGADGTELLSMPLWGGDTPDLGTVDRIGRMALVARRDGGRLELDEVAPELAELLELAGLGVEVQRQAEAREEPLGIERIEEEAQRGDLAP